MIDRAARDRLIGRMLMVGVRGASEDDPALRADLDACRAAGCAAVILFDVDLPAMSALMSAGAPREDAKARAARNILAPRQTRALTDHLKRSLGDGAIIAVDQEGGDVARLSRARGFPSTLSAAAFAALDESKRRSEAAALARTVADAGFTLNLAPCVDLALNPAGPIIAGKRRAYAAHPGMAAACASLVVEAHRSAAVASCLKHFPGHGSSTADSHLGFADIAQTHSPELEWAPYRMLFDAFGRSAFAVMTGHVHHRLFDADHPASLSKAWTMGVLRGRLGFGGAVIVDSLDMGAVTGRYARGEAIVLAINAGADVLLDCNNAPGEERRCPAPEMHEAVAKAVTDGRVDGGLDRLALSASRIEATLVAPARP